MHFEVVVGTPRASRETVRKGSLGQTASCASRRFPSFARKPKMPRSDDLILFYTNNFQTSKLHQSTRVVKIDVYYTIRPFKRTPGTEEGADRLLRLAEVAVFRAEAEDAARRLLFSGTNPGRATVQTQDVRRYNPRTRHRRGDLSPRHTQKFILTHCGYV